mgnify:CR=1 FL=1
MLKAYGGQRRFGIQQKTAGVENFRANRFLAGVVWHLYHQASQVRARESENASFSVVDLANDQSCGC